MSTILPQAVRSLMESFEKLPGIGPKTAARLVFYLLHVPQHMLDTFGDNIKNLKTHTVYCSACFNIGETDPCMICQDITRDKSLLCVIEQPIEIVNLERSGKFKGLYHVLHGAIDPLNNIGPDELKIAELISRLETGVFREIILATNPNMEGEATAMYIKREIEFLKTRNPNTREVAVTRLANGLPVGADLEYADEVTLSRAIEGRREF